MADVKTEKPHETYIHSRCHTHAPTWVCIESDTVARVECCECKKVIVRLRLDAS